MIIYFLVTLRVIAGALASVAARLYAAETIIS